MTKERLDAFTDGVIAILITIMVLDLHPPHAATLEALRPLGAVFGAYAVSFVYLAIYWNNHHHMMHSAKHVNGTVLWANMHLLFWLSLIPFVTSWAGSNLQVPLALTAYGAVLICAACAYTLLTLALVGANGKESQFARSLGGDFKGKVSIVIYAVGIGLAWVNPVLSCLAYISVALMWLVPDRRFVPHSAETKH